jgi:hypothetical protein
MLIFLTVTSATSAARSRHTAHEKCKPDHRHLLAADTHAQVYKVVNKEGPFLEAYGCVYGGRVYRLGGLPEDLTSPTGGAGVEHIALSGSIVAYQDSTFGEVGWARWIVVVRNLRTGRILQKIPTGELEEPNPNLASAGIGPASTIIVKRDGSVAWIAEDRFLSENKPTYYQVNGVDKTGSRVLATGTDIGPKSLALAGSTLYWTQGGQAVSAVLN